MLRKNEYLPGYGPWEYPEEEAEYREAEAARRELAEERADYDRDERRDDALTGDR